MGHIFNCVQCYRDFNHCGRLPGNREKQFQHLTSVRKLGLGAN